MPRAILIDPDAEPVWTDLNPDDINAAVNALLGPFDFTVIHRDTDRHSPGVELAVGEDSLVNSSPHNNVASRIVAALGHTWCVHGRCLLLGLDGPWTVDLTDFQWQHLAGLAGGPIATGGV